MLSSRRRLRLHLLRAFAALSRPWHTAPKLPPSRRPRILLIRPDHLGDLLFLTPALRALRDALPDAHLTALVGPWGLPVLQQNPNLDECIACEFPGFARTPKASWWQPYRVLFRWAAQLRLQPYDVAIVFRFDHWWGALLAYLAGIPCRVGYAIPESAPFLTHPIQYAPTRHEVVQNWALAEQVPRLLSEADTMAGLPEGPGDAPLEFQPSEYDQEEIGLYLSQKGIERRATLIAIHPGAGAPVKRWRPQGYAAVADELAVRYDAPIVITGSQSELDLAWTVAAHMDADPIIACGDTTLGGLAALFQCCRLVIGSDSGPLHLAVAMGTPTVHMYGPVDPSKFGPWGPSAEHLVLLGQCDDMPCDRLDYADGELPHHPCVVDIHSATVLRAAERLLGAPRP